VATRIKIQPGEDGQLMVRLPYSPERVNKIKTVPGRQWEPRSQCWSVPASSGMVEHLIAGHELKAYLLNLVHQGVSQSYQEQVISAIKFLYRHVLKRPERVEDLPRPVRKEKSLPAVLNRGEVRRLFQAVGNLKHRAILLVIYAGGLRRLEGGRH
jgi:site-specific recombinase XerC